MNDRGRTLRLILPMLTRDHMSPDTWLNSVSINAVLGNIIVTDALDRARRKEPTLQLISVNAHELIPDRKYCEKSERKSWPLSVNAKPSGTDSYEANVMFSDDAPF